MKTPEEIEQLAEQYFPDPYICTGREGFIDGYTQCQEDMADKKYTEEDVINLMFMATRWDTFKDGDVEYGMDMDNFFKYLINSLNKQD
jgi:hypothetical protein